MDSKKIKLNFNVESIHLDKEAVKDNRFINAEIEAFATGENCHTEPIDFESLQACADTIYDIPITYSYNKYIDDFEGHEEIQYILGFVKEDRVNNPVKFIKKNDGRIFLKIKGLVWKNYGGNFLDVFAKADNIKAISVEMSIIKGEKLQNGKISIKEWVYDAITVLGDYVMPAIKGANIALQFSKDKEDYLSELNFTEDGTKIEIDNTKDSAISGKWSNPRQKLLNPILKASNKTALLNEAYLIWSDTGEEGVSLSDVSYPHHVVRSGKLVIHKDGLQAAFSRASAQGIVEGRVKAHLLRHYNSLGLDKENFENFGLTKKQFDMYFEEDFRKEDKGLSLTSENKRTFLQKALSKFKTENEGRSCMKYWVRDFDDEFVYVYDYETEELGSFKYTITDNSAEVDESSYKEVKTGYTPLTEEEKFAYQNFNRSIEMEDNDKNDDDDNDDDNDDNDDEEKNGNKDGDKNKGNMSTDDGVSSEPDRATYEELMQKYEKLEEENKAYMEQISKMSDYEDLRQFKSEYMEKEKTEQEMAEMNTVMAKLEEKGIEMTDETKKELYAKKEEFSTISGWSNYVKAFAFDNYETNVNDGIVKMELPNAVSQQKDLSKLGVWGNLINKFNN